MKFRDSIKLIILVVMLIFGCAWLEKICYIPDRSKMNYIHDDDNRIIIYHGINIANSSKYSNNFLPWQTKADLVKLNIWGFNLVRYIFLWEAFEPIKGQYNNEYLNGCIKIWNELKNLGIDVVIDIHQDLYARKFTGNGFPEWTIRDNNIPFHEQKPWNLNYSEPAVITCYTNFWKNDTLKQAYINMVDRLLKVINTMDNIIGIDVMNEPFPGYLVNFEKITLSDFYNKHQDVFFKNGYKKRFFFEPTIQTSTGLPTDLKFTPQKSAIYFPHYYDPSCHEGNPYKSENRRLLARAISVKVKEAQDFGVPILFGEWGVPINVENYNQYISDFLDYTDDYCIGWSYFSYDVGSPMAILDEAGGTRISLSLLSRVYPQKIAGKDPIYKIKDTIFTLTYEKIDTKTPTEIYVPTYRLLNVSATVNGKPVDIIENKLIFYNDENKIQKVKITWFKE
jgi:endoglycosylceramidase